MSEPPIAAAGRRSFTGRIVDACCLAFAAWTLLCNAVVLAQGSLVDLLRLAGLALPALAVAWWLGRRLRPSAGGAAEDRPIASRKPAGVLDGTGRAAALAAGILILSSYPATGNFTLFWWLFTTYFAVAVLITMRRPIADGDGTRAPRRQELLLIGLGVLCALITLLAHRPDNDEAFYVNLGVTAADHPERPLLGHEGIHGIDGLELTAYYRVTSIEVLAGAVTYLTGIPTLAVSHWLVATAAGFLVPLAYARLFREIGGRGWLSAVAAAMIFLLVDGSAHANYGNLAFVRLYQGKCIFLSVVAPSIVAYAWRFARRPSPARWTLLAAAMIAGVGLSSSAVWSGPLLAALALAAAWRPGRRGLTILAVGAGAACYPLLAGLVLKLGARVSAGQAVPRDVLLGLPEQAFAKVLDGNLAPLAVATLAWLLLRPGLGARFATVFPLGFALLLNPYSAPWVAHNLTGIRTFWRVFWLLPLPVLVGLAAIGCRRLLREAPDRATRLIGLVGAVALAATLFPTRYTLSRANDVEIKLPALKMPAVFDRVEMVNRSVTPPAYVLAPPEISQWLSTQNRHAYPLISIPKYLRGRLEPGDLERRARLMAYVSGRQRAGIGPDALRRGLSDYNLSGVCLDVRAPWLDEMRGTLARERFRQTATRGAYEMWTSTRQAEPGR